MSLLFIIHHFSSQTVTPHLYFSVPQRWRSKDIAHMIFGMQSTRISDVGAIEFLRVIIRIIEDSIHIRMNDESVGQCQSFTAREMSMILYGMQCLRSVNEGA
jgi:hypothetical protein